MLTSAPLGTVSVALFGNPVFADVIRSVKMGLGQAPNPYDWCPSKKRKFGHRDTEGRPWDMEAEIGVM